MANLVCAALTTAQFMAEEMLGESANKQDYVATVAAVNAIKENQTARLEYIENPSKKLTARVWWSKFCNDTVNDCSSTPSDYCSFTGAEADVECKDYAIDKCFSKAFTIDEAQYEVTTADFATQLAKQTLRVKKVLDEQVDKYVLAQIQSFATQNQFVQSPYVIAGTTTEVAPALFSPEFMIYLTQVAQGNKFTSPFIIDGNNLYTHYQKALLNSGNANGSGAKNMFDLLKYYNDFINLEAITPKHTFLIDRGSIAMANRARNAAYSATSPAEHGVGGMKYSEASANIPGLIYDVYHRVECSGAYNKHHFMYEVNLGVFNSATACNGASGVLQFACV